MAGNIPDWTSLLALARSSNAAERSHAIVQAQSMLERYLGSQGHRREGDTPFHAVVTRAALEYGLELPGDLRDVIRLRNQISHEGHIPGTLEAEDAVEVFQQCFDRLSSVLSNRRKRGAPRGERGGSTGEQGSPFPDVRPDARSNPRSNAPREPRSQDSSREKDDAQLELAIRAAPRPRRPRKVVETPLEPPDGWPGAARDTMELEGFPEDDDFQDDEGGPADMARATWVEPPEGIRRGSLWEEIPEDASREPLEAVVDAYAGPPAVRPPLSIRRNAIDAAAAPSIEVIVPPRKALRSPPTGPSSGSSGSIVVPRERGPSDAGVSSRGARTGGARTGGARTSGARTSGARTRDSGSSEPIDEPEHPPAVLLFGYGALAWLVGVTVFLAHRIYVWAAPGTWQAQIGWGAAGALAGLIGALVGGIALWPVVVLVGLVGAGLMTGGLVGAVVGGLLGLLVGGDTSVGFGASIGGSLLGALTSLVLLFRYYGMLVMLRLK